jgi:hypothetical protein
MLRSESGNCSVQVSARVAPRLRDETIRAGLDLALEFKVYGRGIDRNHWSRTTEHAMGTFTRNNTELAVDIEGAGQQHRAEAGGMTIALESWNAGLDTAEWFAELPGGACQEPHWGYCLKGKVTMRYADGQTDVISAGDAYYIRPGHNAHIDEDAEFVEFTLADQTPGINTVDLEPTDATVGA